MNKKNYCWTLFYLFIPLCLFSQTLVEFVIHTPKHTNNSKNIFITGNHPNLGSWKANGLAAKKAGPGLHIASAKFEAGQDLEFKVTRGDFSTVEKTEKGMEIPNRKFKVPEHKKAQITIKVKNWADNFSSDKKHKLNITGLFKHVKGFVSKNLSRKRDLVILLPPSYFQKEAKKTRYPVFYMHDGNNLFDPGLSFTGVDWGVDEAYSRLVKSGKMKEIIVVGIYNTADRMAEYTPFVDKKHKGGAGEQYRKFIVDELKPYIDQNFRTKTNREDTAIGGSSLGGLISIYIGFSNPEIFGSIMAMSPSVWWSEWKIINWTLNNIKPEDKTKLWIDIGTNEEGESYGLVKLFAKKLKDNFPNYNEIRFLEIPGGLHTESAWRDRIDKPLTWFFQPQP